MALSFLPEIFMEEGGWTVSDINPVLYNIIYFVRGYIFSIFGGFIGAAFVLVTINSLNGNRLSVLQIWDELKNNFSVLLKFITVVFIVFELIYSAAGVSLILYNDDELSSLAKIHLVVNLSVIGSLIGAAYLLVATVGAALILKFNVSYVEASYGMVNYLRSTPIFYITVSLIIALFLSFDIEYFYLLNLLNSLDIQFNSVELGMSIFMAFVIVLFSLMMVLYFLCPIILSASLIFQLRQFEKILTQKSLLP